MMIEINLLPEELKKIQARFKKIDMPTIDMKNLPYITIGAILIGVLIIIQVIAFIVGVIGKANLSSLSKRYSTILPSKKEADSLKSQIDLINKKVHAIDELMVKRFSWARELNSLSDSMTAGIWLTELSYDEKFVSLANVKGANNKAKVESAKSPEKVLLRYLTISGYASSRGEEGTALIGKFIKILKDNQEFYIYFSDIELGSIKSEKVEDQEVMSFKITCFFKETE